MRPGVKAIFPALRQIDGFSFETKSEKNEYATCLSVHQTIFQNFIRNFYHRHVNSCLFPTPH